MSQQPGFSAYGAVDLSSLRTPAPATSTTGEDSSESPYVVDVTEATFQAEVIDRSMTVPVVIDLWATWCGPCKQLSPILERLADADAGKWVLAKIDVDANPRISSAFAVQSIPTTFAVIKGQPVPLFQGAIPEAQVRQYVSEVLRVAEANGLTGRLEGAAGPSPVEEVPEPALPSGFDEAFDAIERGDLDAAAAAYNKLLADDPGDPDAKAGLAQVELLRRAEANDPDEVRRTARQQPDDLQAQLDGADLELLDGQVDEAFRRLVDFVRRSSGADRDAARQRLLELFEIVGGDDERVVRARRDLSSALF